MRPERSEGASRRQDHPRGLAVEAELHAVSTEDRTINRS